MSDLDFIDYTLYEAPYKVDQSIPLYPISIKNMNSAQRLLKIHLRSKFIEAHSVREAILSSSNGALFVSLLISSMEPSFTSFEGAYLQRFQGTCSFTKPQERETVFSFCKERESGREERLPSARPGLPILLYGHPGFQLVYMVLQGFYFVGIDSLASISYLWNPQH